MPMEFIELKPARERRGWTQEQLAELSGVDKATISRLESGVITNPLYETVRELERALKLRQTERLAFGQERVA
jgi:transcriptional regulator with XRE-family HTH domain